MGGGGGGGFHIRKVSRGGGGGVMRVSRNFQRTRGSEKWILGASELRSLEESDVEFSDL